MLTGCRNCGGYFTQAELVQRKPPVHRWPLTKAGERMLAENNSRGPSQQCPTCGNSTLRSAPTTSSAAH